jgi:hypothetical protein
VCAVVSQRCVPWYHRGVCRGITEVCAVVSQRVRGVIPGAFAESPRGQCMKRRMVLAECRVVLAECGVVSAEMREVSAECGVVSVEMRVVSVECGGVSVECRGSLQKRQLAALPPCFGQFDDLFGQFDALFGQFAGPVWSPRRH